jgi:hypothetical protein
MLQVLKSEEHHHKCQSHIQNKKLAAAWQSCDNITDNFILFRVDDSNMHTNNANANAVP